MTEKKKVRQKEQVMSCLLSPRSTLLVHWLHLSSVSIQSLGLAAAFRGTAWDGGVLEIWTRKGRD